MNFAKFRQTGELSDITVDVDGTEFKLHKFPLYAKSEFFCTLTKNAGAESHQVELRDFPGGPEVFGIVADFCYNMKVDISKANVVQLRCAAEVLQMFGSGNLAEVSEKFLTDTITSSKMSRATSAIASLLVSCVSLGSLAEKGNIVTLCMDALVESWLKPPTKFSSPNAPKKQPNDGDDRCLQILACLPVDWFVKLVILSRDKGVKFGLLADMATHYITVCLEKDEADDRSQTKDQRKLDSLESKTVSKANRNTHDLDLLKDAKSGMVKSKKKSDTGKIVDAILLELPDDAFKEDAFTTDWVTKVLKVATAHGCLCRRHLVKIAADRLDKLSPEDLCLVAPSVLHDVVSETGNGDNGQGQKACQLVDTYVCEMARKGVLTAETYKTLVTATPVDCRKDHDALYNVLEYVLTAEKDKLTPEQTQGLIETVDFSRLGEATLQRAFGAQIVPASFVAKGALALCSKLKSELENARSTVCKQEDELNRLRRGRTVTPTVTSSPKKEVDAGFEPPVRDTSSAKAMEPLELNANPTEDILMAARNKLASSVAAYNTFRPVTTDADYGYDDDLDYKYERNYRSLDNTRTKPRSFRSSYLYPHRI